MIEIRPNPPADFDSFWHDTYSEAASADLDFDLSSPVEAADIRIDPKAGQTNPGTISEQHCIRTLSFRGIGGVRLNGWIAAPHDSGVHPAFLWIAPYGRESLQPNQYGTRQGFVSLSFNFFGSSPFLQEKYSPAKGYFAEGVLAPETWIFRTMFQHGVIASRVLAAFPGVDEARVGSMGMSQGGGMSIWLGAWSPLIKAVCADMPFLGAMERTLMKNVYRYPLKELMDFMGTDPDRQREVLRTISYYDTLNQATRCTKPTLVSVGLKDPAVKPVQARAIYAALPGEKRLIEYDLGHDWHPKMVENNRDWLIQHL